LQSFSVAKGGTDSSTAFDAFGIARWSGATGLEAYFAQVLQNPEARRALLSAMNTGSLSWSTGTEFLNTRMGASTSPLGGALAAIIEHVDRELEHDVSVFERVDYTPVPEHVPEVWAARLADAGPARDEDFALDWSVGDEDEDDEAKPPHR
jgi:hypothetical protein